MNQVAPNVYFEQFLSAGERAKATNRLAKLREGAIPILESLFSGSAKNKFGVPYNEIGALDCGYATAKILGKLAKPLESYIRDGIDSDHPYAIEAAGSIVELEKETVISLAKALVRNPFSEASYYLVKCGEGKNPEVLGIIENCPKAVYSLEKTINYLKSRT